MEFSLAFQTTYLRSFKKFRILVSDSWLDIKRLENLVTCPHFLKKAHFLPIRHRIDYKIALTVFKCINNIAPDYLKKCISIKDEPLKLLRTDKDYFLLNIPSVPHYRRTERSFSFCGPNVWNKLPYNLRTCNEISIFKKLLKHHLFSKAFSEYWLIWLYSMS